MYLFFLVFNFSTQTSKFAVSIKAPIGELMQRAPLSEDEFKTEQGNIYKTNAVCFSLVCTHPVMILKFFFLVVIPFLNAMFRK